LDEVYEYTSYHDDVQETSQESDMRPRHLRFADDGSLLATSDDSASCDSVADTKLKGIPPPCGTHIRFDEEDDL